MTSPKKRQKKSQKNMSKKNNEACAPISAEEVFSGVVRDLRRPVYELSVPCYILDINYKYLAW